MNYIQRIQYAHPGLGSQLFSVIAYIGSQGNGEVRGNIRVFNIHPKDVAGEFPVLMLKGKTPKQLRSIDHPNHQKALLSLDEVCFSFPDFPSFKEYIIERMGKEYPLKIPLPSNILKPAYSAIHLLTAKTFL